MRFVAIRPLPNRNCKPSIGCGRRRHQRTAVINQLRGLLLEFGITVPREDRRPCADTCRDPGKGRRGGSVGRDLVAELQQEWVHLDERIAALEQTAAAADADLGAVSALQTIPGIGVLRASAFVACLRHGRQLASGI